MSGVNIAILMGMLIIITGIALVGVQVLESNGKQLQDHDFRLIGADAGSANFKIETSFPGVPIIALGVILVIIGSIFSRSN